jgi:hypothetical protein
MMQQRGLPLKGYNYLPALQVTIPDVRTYEVLFL